MIEKLLKNKNKTIIIGMIASLGISAGFATDLIIFTRIFAVSFSIFYLIQYFVSLFLTEDPKIPELENMLIESDGVMKEQEEVISEYERLLDSVSTQLPCACGGNMFEGIFQPGIDNFVECEKCQSKYKVTVDFTSILMSEPMNQKEQEV